MRAITKDFGLKLFSVAASFGLWLYVQSQMASTHLDQVHFTLVPINLDTTKLQLANAGRTPNGMDYTVEADGPPEVTAVLDAIVKKTKPVAYVDLSNAQAGVFSYPVTFDKPFNDPRLSWKRGQDVTLDLVQVGSVSKDVRVDPVSIPDGFAATFGVSQPQVLLRGPQAELARVSEVRAQVDLSHFKVGQGAVYNVKLDILDRRGNIVQAVSADPPIVTVYPALTAEQKRKNLPIIPVWSGTPMANYSTDGPPEVTPNQVWVQSDDAGVLRTVDHVSTEPIDWNGATSTIIKTVRIVIPEGVKLEKGMRKSVRVVQRIRANPSPPAIRNTPAQVNSPSTPGH